jgi:sec-independent protein translocase protein TatB
MLDFSWSEFLVVLVVAVLAIGPKQLPDVLYGLGRMVRRFQYFRFAVGKQFDMFMEHADLNEIRKSAPMISLHELDEKAHDDDHHGEPEDLPVRTETEKPHDGA